MTSTQLLELTSLWNNPGPARTDTAALNRSQDIVRGSADYQQTRAEATAIGSSLLSSRPRVRSQYFLKDRGQKAEVPAVVVKISDESVTLSCQVSGRTIEATFPRNYIDSRLAVYGTPVTLALREEGGIRKPVIEGREITRRPQTDELKALDEWLES